MSLRQPNLTHRVAHGERIRKVVDVFAGAGKVGELLQVFATKLNQLFANEVFDCLYVVAGNGLGGGKGFYVSIREIFDNGT
ncbi:unannotated protein [freshwater metagenome]|uniref:Unannotated protein n=1 Tax=freshwater metagenome TaxID=449393 RepID=A0A6J6C4U7_9ZZZZ